MENYGLAEKILNKLRREHKKAKEKWQTDRIKAVFLLGSGWTVSNVSEATAEKVLMMDEKTIHSHFQTWESGGIDVLKLGCVLSIFLCFFNHSLMKVILIMAR